jgi:hypothetical protein
MALFTAKDVIVAFRENVHFAKHAFLHPQGPK